MVLLRGIDFIELLILEIKKSLLWLFKIMKLFSKICNKTKETLLVNIVLRPLDLRCT